MPETQPVAGGNLAGGTGLAAARELAAREAKLANSKTQESKVRSVDEKVVHAEEKSGTGAAPVPTAARVGGHRKRASSGGAEHKTQSGVPHQEGDIVLPATIKAQRILDGFRIVSMNMSDAQTGKIMWETAKDWESKDFEQEIKAYVPKKILQCKEVAREITFYSKQLMNNFRLEQRVFFQGVCIEEWNFEFGFVIPGSKNSWQQSIEAADEMYPAEILSGNITFETSFYDAQLLICKSVVRVFYVD